MIRRHLVSALAVLALGLVVAAPAEAGGASPGAVGVKKNAYVKIANTTASPYYVVVVPSTLQVPATPFQAQRLGAILVNPGKTVLYPVPASTGLIIGYPTAAVPADPNALLNGGLAFGNAYTVAKGKTQGARIVAGPNILVP